MEKYRPLNPLIWGQGGHFGARGHQNQKIKKKFFKQNISSGYFSERKNWEKHDKNTFRSIGGNHKKLLRKRAKNTVFLTIFGIFDRDPLRPGTKRKH